MSSDPQTSLAVAAPNGAGPGEKQSALELRAGRILVRAGPRLRYHLVRVGPAGLSGLASLVIAAIAAVVVVLPAHRSVESLREELGSAGRARPAAPEQVHSPAEFASSLPLRAQVPALLSLLLVQANEAGITLEQGKYVYVPANSTHLAKYSLEFPVKGDYGNIRAFIDKSLIAIPALTLEKLQIERKNIGDLTVSADVGYVIYLRGS